MNNNTPNMNTKIDSVARRWRLDSIVGKFHLFVLLTATLYAIALICSRLLAVIPDYFDPITLLAPPGLALILAIIFNHRPKREQCARLMDDNAKSEDLFLTATLLERSAGMFKPLVLVNAEKKSTEVKPKEVVPFRWGRKFRNSSCTIIILALGVYFLPQLDPFGHAKARNQVKEEKKKLKNLKKATKERLKLLKKKPVGKTSPEVEKALQDLKDIFKNMRKNPPKVTNRKLKKMQKRLSELWKAKNKQKMSEMSKRNMGRQSFGASQKRRKWRQQLKKGDLSGMKKELKKLAEEAKKLAQAPNSAAKKQALKKLQKQMKQLSDFMKQEMGSKSCQSAMQRAMEQGAMAQKNQLSKDALNSLAESLNLSSRELQRLSQMMNDINNLEQAMNASQLARQLQKMKGGKGNNPGDLEGMMEYAELFKKMMEGKGKGKGKGKGEGTGGTGGEGKGNAPPDENDKVKTAFKDQKTKTKLQVGKILMKWKTREVSKSGNVQENYDDSIKQVKEGVGEAILKEQVPPGYHDAIKKYFDSL